jgi:adenylylsulfate kinase-like enzyme
VTDGDALRDELGHAAARDLVARIQEARRIGKDAEVVVVIEVEAGAVVAVTIPKRHQVRPSRRA